MKVTQKWTDSREVDYKAIFHHGTFPAAHKREWASLLFHESRLIFHPSPSKKKKKKKRHSLWSLYPKQRFPLSGIRNMQGRAKTVITFIFAGTRSARSADHTRPLAAHSGDYGSWKINGVKLHQPARFTPRVSDQSVGGFVSLFVRSFRVSGSLFHRDRLRWIGN